MIGTPLFDSRKMLSQYLLEICDERRDEIARATADDLDEIAQEQPSPLIEITSLNRSETEFDVSVHGERTHVRVSVPLVGSRSQTLMFAPSHSPAGLAAELKPGRLVFARDFAGTPTDNEIRGWAKSMVDQTEMGVTNQIRQVQAATDQWYATDQPSAISRRRAELAAAAALKTSLAKGI